MLRHALPACLGLIAASLLCSGPAYAQSNPLKTFKDAPKLSRSDLSLMDKTAEKLYGLNTVGDGTNETWTNPRTGDSGTVTVLNSFEKTDRGTGMACRKVQYELSMWNKIKTTAYTVDWCRQPNGKWKLG